MDITVLYMTMKLCLSAMATIYIHVHTCMNYKCVPGGRVRVKTRLPRRRAVLRAFSLFRANSTPYA